MTKNLRWEFNTAQQCHDTSSLRSLSRSETAASLCSNAQISPSLPHCRLVTLPYTSLRHRSHQTGSPVSSHHWIDKPPPIKWKTCPYCSQRPTPALGPGSRSFSPSQGLRSCKYPLSFLNHQFLPSQLDYSHEHAKCCSTSHLKKKKKFPSNNIYML